MHFIKNSINSWALTGASSDSYGDIFPDGMTFTTTSYSAPYSKNGSYLVNSGAVLGVYQQLSTRAGGEVISSDTY